MLLCSCGTSVRECEAQRQEGPRISTRIKGGTNSHIRIRHKQNLRLLSVEAKMHYLARRYNLREQKAPVECEQAVARTLARHR